MIELILHSCRRYHARRARLASAEDQTETDPSKSAETADFDKDRIPVLVSEYLAVAVLATPSRRPT